MMIMMMIMVMRSSDNILYRNTVLDMTYNVFGGTLNLTQLQLHNFFRNNYTVPLVFHRKPSNDKDAKQSPRCCRYLHVFLLRTGT